MINDDKRKLSHNDMRGFIDVPLLRYSGTGTCTQEGLGFALNGRYFLAIYSTQPRLAPSNSFELNLILIH